MPAQRVAGSIAVVPDDADQAAMNVSSRQRDKRVRSTFQVCIDPHGAVTGATMMESTGYPRYDARIARALAGWRYTPVEVDGRAITVCTVVTIHYAQIR